MGHRTHSEKHCRIIKVRKWPVSLYPLMHGKLNTGPGYIKWKNNNIQAHNISYIFKEFITDFLSQTLYNVKSYLQTGFKLIWSRVSLKKGYVLSSKTDVKNSVTKTQIILPQVSLYFFVPQPDNPFIWSRQIYTEWRNLSNYLLKMTEKPMIHRWNVLHKIM